MLCELFIENLAVIEQTSIQLKDGLNVFTGETGAGKSIVIDAVGAVLGKRTTRELVRHGAERAQITARFSEVSDSVRKKLSDAGISLSPDEDLIISREIAADGKSTARMMGRPVTAALLREVGNLLIHIHGQHDNHVLLAPENHLHILDSFGDYDALIAEYMTQYRLVVSLKREMKRLTIDKQQKSQQLSFLTQTVQEIEEAQLCAGEEETLEQTRVQMRASEKIAAALQQAYQLLSAEGAAADLAFNASHALAPAAALLPQAAALFDQLEPAAEQLSALGESIGALLENLSFYPGQLEEVENRLDLIRRLKRNYHVETVEALLLKKEEAQRSLTELETSDETLAQISEEAAREYPKLLRLAEKLSDARKKAADRFVATVSKELAFLDMPSVRLAVDLKTGKPGVHGRDTAEFLISTNAGEPPKPIARIASGGELSRIMLAIKNTLADRDEIPTLIFDEIDTGVSGRAAQKIGLKLKQASKNRQVLSVTHSAQIAALADHQYLIRKETDGKRTFTKVHELSERERIEEVARIMSTDQITDLMRSTAAQMIEQGKNTP